MTVRVAFLQHSEWDLPGILGERARELRFTTETFRADRGADTLPRSGAFDLLVIMGSAESATNRQLRWIDDERRLVAHAVTAGVPVLGVCFGGQLLAQALGAEVDRAPRPEIGWRRVDTDDPERIPAGPWVVWHEDAFSAPPGADVVARTEVSLHAYILGVHTGVQFHPEVTSDIVARWVDDARADDRISDTEAAELLSGFDGSGSGPEDQARRLFDRFVERAGHRI
jgi:GMP synthase-like glutamine amidotransferase